MEIISIISLGHWLGSYSASMFVDTHVDTHWERSDCLFLFLLLHGSLKAMYEKEQPVLRNREKDGHLLSALLGFSLLLRR